MNNFRTFEEWNAAYQQAPDKEAFIAQYGEFQPQVEAPPAELATTSTPAHVALDPPIIPVESDTAQSTLDDSIKPETVNEEDGTVSEADMTEEAYQKLQQQKLEQEEVTAENYQQKVDLARQRGIEENAYRDQNGQIMLDPDGRPIMRELSTFEKIENTAENMVDRFQNLIPNAQIMAGEVMNRIVGDELWDNYNEYGSASVLANMPMAPGGASAMRLLFANGMIPTDEDVDQALREKIVRQAEAEARGEVGSISEGIANGDLAEIGAGLINAASSFVPSIVMGLATGGTSTGAEMFGDMYTEYNKAAADAKGKTIEELRADKEDSFYIPLALAAPATALEMVGFKGASNAIIKHAGRPLAKRTAAALMAGNKEGATEFFQTGLEVANQTLAETNNDVAAAAEKAVDTMFSQQGLEAYLQGFAGGAGFSGGGLVKQSDLAELRAASTAMRTERENQIVYDALAKKAQLRDLKKKTNDPDLLETYNAQLKQLDGVIKSGIVHGNGYVRKMDDSQITKAAKLADRESAARERWGAIQQKFTAGQITVDEKNAAAQAFGAEIREIRQQEQEMKDSLEEQPNIRDKKGQMTGTGLWNTSVKQAMDKAIETKGPEGAWDVIQNPNFKKFLTSKVGAVWNKIPSDIQGATTLDDVVNEVMMGGTVPPSQTVVGTFEAFTPGKSKPSSYFLGNIDNKITGAIQALTQQGKQGRESGQGVVIEGQEEGQGPQIEDTSEIQETARRRTAVEQAERLGIGPTFTKELEGKMETLVADGVLNPEDKKFESTYVQRFRDHMAKPIRAAMGKKANYEQWIQDHAQELLNIYSPRTLSKKRNDPAFAWIENPPTAQEFIDYHLPIREDGKPHPDRAKRQTRLAEAIAEGIGFRAMEDTMAKQIDQSTRGTVNAGFDKVIDTLRKLQGDRGTLQSNPLAVLPAAAIGAVQTAKKLYNAGMDLNNAMRQAWDSVKDQVGWEQFRDAIVGGIREAEGEGFRDKTQNWADAIEQREQKEQQEAAQTVQDVIQPGTSVTTNADNEFSQFQQTVQEQEDSFTRQGGDTSAKSIWDDLVEQEGMTPLNVVKNESDREAAQQWVVDKMMKRFPKSFFTGTMFSGLKGYGFWHSASKDFFPVRDGLSDDHFAANDAGGINWSDVGPIKYGRANLRTGAAKKQLTKKLGRTPTDLEVEKFRVQKNKELIKRLENKPEELARRNKANMDALEYMYKQFEGMIAEDKENIRYIAAWLKGGANSQDFINRYAAPFKGYSEKSFDPNDGAVEEHTMPQVAVARYMVASAINGTVDQNFPNIRTNYFQVQIAESEDNKLAGIGPDGKKFNYKKSMPEGWKPNDSSWARYFNANVNTNEGGFFADQIYLIEDKKTLAEKFGVPGNSNSEVVRKAQNDVIAEKEGDRFEQMIDKTIAGIEKLTGPKGALQANIAAIPAHILVGGLRAAKLAYRGARDLSQAIEAGYQHVKDFMSRQEWADFTAKAINEVKDEPTGRTVGLQFATENAVKLQQQADINEKFNEIIEQKTGGKIPKDNVISKGDIGAPKKLSAVRRFFMHPSAEDMKGLLYTILPSGKEGDQAWKYFQETIFKPYQKGVTEMNAYKANLHDGSRMASKLASNAKLNKTIPDTGFSWNQAARVAMAVRNGQEITGMNPESVQKLLEAIAGDPKMDAYVDKMNELFDGNFKWNVDDLNRPLAGELAGMADKVKRSEFLKEYQANADIVFSEENLNKIEKVAGPEVRDNIEKTLARMKSGRNRTVAPDSSTNKLLDWINNAQAMIMFANMRSAALQSLSMFNYVNTGGNNMFKAGKNLANYPQYRQDFKTLWNSDYLKGRRKGLGFDIAADEVAAAATDTKALNGLFDKIRAAGFIPTQLMDSFAISRGGALYYRARLDQYKKDGHPDPEGAAMADFIDLTEESQQSADPSRISQIQAGPLGRIVFAFGNTPFQYARVMKRAIQDLGAGRGSWKNNVARISYYTAGQAMLFNTLQQALWMGDDEEREEKQDRAILGAIQSFFKSLGLGGAAAATGMGIIAETQKEGRKNYISAAVSLSPPISAKLRQLGQAANALDKEEYGKASMLGAEAVANVPTARVMTKFNNLQDILTEDLDGWEILLKSLGWSNYALSIDDNEPIRGRVSRRSKRGDRERRRDPRERRESRRRSALQRWSAEDSPFKFLAGRLAGIVSKVGENMSFGTQGAKMDRGNIFGAAGNKAGRMRQAGSGAKPRLGDSFGAAGLKQASQMSGGIGSIASSLMNKAGRMAGDQAQMTGGQAQLASNNPLETIRQQRQQASQQSRSQAFGTLEGAAPGTAAVTGMLADKGFFGKLAAKRRAQNEGPNDQAQAAPQDATGQVSLTPEMDQQNAQMQQQNQQAQQNSQQIQQMQQMIEKNQATLDAQMKDSQESKQQIQGEFQNASEQLTGLSDSFEKAANQVGAQGQETPLMKLGRGELGQAHNDGTIEIDPSLKGEERERVIAHEQKHADEMEAGNLDYDDNAIYYHGKTYPRKDGKIKYNGKWLKEGDPSFPWEKVAYDAEKEVGKSPVKQTDENTRNRERVRKLREEKQAYQEKYHPTEYQIGRDQQGKARKEAIFIPQHGGGQDLMSQDDFSSLPVSTNESPAEGFIEQWYSNPETIKRLQKDYPDMSENEIFEMITRGVHTPTQEWDKSSALYDPSTTTSYVPRGQVGGAYDAHERTHATGLDIYQGGQIADILGPVEFRDGLGNLSPADMEYINTPQELGAYIMQARFDYGLKPGQKVTEEQAQEILDNYSKENKLLQGIKQSGKLKEFTKVLNTVASNDERPSLRDLYSNRDSGLARVDGKKKKKGKKEVSHEVTVPAYTKHYGAIKEGNYAPEYYHQGIGGSEGGQGGVIYQQTRRNPGKSGGTAYTLGALQNSYGDPIGVAGVGREWDLGKGWTAGVHGGATYGYGTSYNKMYKEHAAKRGAEARAANPDISDAEWRLANEGRSPEEHWEQHLKSNRSGMEKFVDETNVAPLVTGQIGKTWKSGLGLKATINPLYTNLGVSYKFKNKKKRKK